MLQSEQERGLSHLIGQWMSGPALQRAMINAGINIFVNEYTDKYVSTCGKVCIVTCWLLEEKKILDSSQDWLYLVMSMLC